MKRTENPKYDIQNGDKMKLFYTHWSYIIQNTCVYILKSNKFYNKPNYKWLPQILNYF